MQERAADDPGRCYAIEAGPGEVVVVPPGWAHATVSVDPQAADDLRGLVRPRVRLRVRRGAVARGAGLLPAASCRGREHRLDAQPALRGASRSSSAGHAPTRSSGSSRASRSTARSRATRRRCSGSPTPPGSRTSGRGLNREASAANWPHRARPHASHAPVRRSRGAPGIDAAHIAVAVPVAAVTGGTMRSILSGVVVVALAAVPAWAERVSVSLDGTWQIADSVAASPAPRVFPATVAVPGLVHNATPVFPDVDAFDSVELVNNKIAQKLLPESARVAAPGVSRQKRNYFWYRRTFTAPATRSRRDPADRQGPVRHRGVAQRPEDGRVPGLLLGRDLRPHARDAVAGRERAPRPRRGAPGGPARHLPGGNGLREAEVDARDLRRGLAPSRRQPGDRERPGGAADRLGRDPRRDEGPQPGGGPGDASSWRRR